MIWPVCIGCRKHPEEIAEYRDVEVTGGLTPDDYVRNEEGTYNPANGHFACTDCYVKMGAPSRPAPERWIAP
jgi:hypothetical protein